MREKKTSPRRFQYGGFAVLTFAVAVFAIFAEQGIYRFISLQSKVRDQERLGAVSQGYSRRIQANIREGIVAVDTLELVLKAASFETVRFDEYASTILDSAKTVSVLQYAPEGVVQNIYPMEGNEGAVGHDLLGDTRRDSGAQATILSREVTMIGPVTLIQNGLRALIIRKPIFFEDRFYGFSIALLPLDNVLVTETDVLDVQNIAFRIYGYDPDALPGERPIIQESDRFPDNWDATFPIIIPGGEWELQIAFVDGSSLDGTRVRVFLQIGIIGFAVTIIFLLFLNRRDALALANTAEKYRLITENVVDAIWVYNVTAGRFLYVSPSTGRPLGYSAEEMMHQSIEDASPGDRDGNILAVLRERAAAFIADESKDRYVDIVPRVHRDGSHRWVEATTSFGYTDDRDVKITGISRDITDRKNLEEQLKAANIDLSEANATKDKMFSVIAHDLRSPLARIVDITAVLNDREISIDSEEGRDFLKHISGAASDTLQLLDNLLGWSRSQLGRVQFHPQTLRFGNEVEAVLSTIRHQADGKGVHLQCEIDAQDTIFADPDLLRTILRNLLANAIKFSHRSGTVRISGSQSENGYEISVSDDGVGMSDTIRRRLVAGEQDIHTRGTENEPGSGLGLQLCRDFIDRHGGTLEITSEVGKGSTFTVRL